MKKLLATIVLLAVAIIPMTARNRVTTNVRELPAAAQATLNKYFSKNKVNHIKIDKKTFGGAEYDVILNNGTEIEFDNKGNWKEINCGINKVPDGLILKSITDYVKTNFKKQHIVSIEVGSNKYEIELSSGLEVEFDRAGRFIRIDQ